MPPVIGGLLVAAGIGGLVASGSSLDKNSTTTTSTPLSAAPATSTAPVALGPVTSTAPTQDQNAVTNETAIDNLRRRQLASQQETYSLFNLNNQSSQSSSTLNPSLFGK